MMHEMGSRLLALVLVVTAGAGMGARHAFAQC